MLAERLKRGDTIGVIAPDKALRSEQKIYLENATKYFKSFGLKVNYGKYLISDTEYCAGTPKQRAEDLKATYPQYTWKPGKRLTGRENKEFLENWING